MLDRVHGVLRLRGRRLQTPSQRCPHDWEPQLRRFVALALAERRADSVAAHGRPAKAQSAARSMQTDVVALPDASMCNVNLQPHKSTCEKHSRFFMPNRAAPSHRGSHREPPVSEHQTNCRTVGRHRRSLASTLSRSGRRQGAAWGRSGCDKLGLGIVAALANLDLQRADYGPLRKR